MGDRMGRQSSPRLTGVSPLQKPVSIEVPSRTGSWRNSSCRAISPPMTDYEHGVSKQNRASQCCESAITVTRHCANSWHRCQSIESSSRSARKWQSFIGTGWYGEFAAPANQTSCSGASVQRSTESGLKIVQSSAVSSSLKKGGPYYASIDATYWRRLFWLARRGIAIEVKLTVFADHRT